MAMASLNASHLLLVDEIGAGLDIDEARTLYRLISQLIKKSRARAAVVVEHKLELLAEFATGISLIEDGIVSQRADCNEASQLAHLMDRMFDRRREIGAGSSLERRGLQ
jgi:ABC-type branched-subunit amino acid transport system ATPase component